MAYKIYEDFKVIFEMRGPFAQLATNTMRKQVVQAAMRVGGEWFRTERVPMRFTDWVYRLGYRVTNSWKAFKRRTTKSGRALPYIGTTPPGGGDILSLAGGNAELLVHNNEKMAVAMSRGCRVDIAGTSKGGDILIRTPFGHPLRPEYAEAFTRVTPEEYQMVARLVVGAFQDFLAGAKPKGGRSKKLVIDGESLNWIPRGRQATGRDTGTISHRRAAG